MENVLYKKRKEKNQRWLRDVSQECAEKIAKAGLVANDDSQVVVCISCSREFRGWTDSDDPLKCHKQLQPDCLYVKIAKMLKTEKSCDSVEDSPKLIEEDLFSSLKSFIASSKFEVAHQELSYDADLLVALAVKRKVDSKNSDISDEYSCAGDLVNDADEATCYKFYTVSFTP